MTRIVTIGTLLWSFVALAEPSGSRGSSTAAGHDATTADTGAPKTTDSPKATKTETVPKSTKPKGKK
jgi:hypothetical protein